MEPSVREKGAPRVAIPASALHYTSLTKVDHAIMFVLLVSAACVRLYGLDQPARVVFDEVHFGGFAREYMWGDFFMDVHPPLAKLGFFAVALASGWDGQFGFELVGQSYPQDGSVPYVVMRAFPAVCGVLTVLVTFGALRASGCRKVVATFGATLVMIENSMVTQSRYILLDSPMLLAVAFAWYCHRKAHLYVPLLRRWLKFTAGCGLGLAVAVSIKWLGVFALVFLVAISAKDYWHQIGDLRVTTRRLAAQLVARVVALVVVPIVVYLGCFAVHFILLPGNAGGAGVLSPEFKATLGHDPETGPLLRDMPAQVLYGSRVALKHVALGGYLHLHPANYTSGSHEQQVTLYGFDPDANNEWVLEMKQRLHPGELERKVRPIKDGDTVRLLHRHTGKFLRATDVRPPISEQTYNNEVSCLGRQDMEPHDPNFEWRVRTLAKRDRRRNDLAMIKLRTAELVFQLIHVGTKCVLYAHADKLPKLAFGQMEVMCVDEPTIANTLWFVEQNWHPQLESANSEDPVTERVHLRRLGFWGKFWELQRAMWRLNLSITEYHEYLSGPETWPFVSRGIAFLDGAGGNSAVYLLGNVAIYVGAFLTIALAIAKLIFYLLAHANPFVAVEDLATQRTFYGIALELVVGWTLNYAPYFHMKRQTFLHHYLPLLYLLILLVAQYAEYQWSRRPRVAAVLMLAVVGLAVFCYTVHSPLIYGTPWTRTACVMSRWQYGWDFGCDAYINL